MAGLLTQAVKKWEPNSKRWLFELAQNAHDATPDTETAEMEVTASATKMERS